VVRVQLVAVFVLTSQLTKLNISQTCTIPLDTAKVRLQLQGKALAGAENVLPKYRGMIGTVGTIAREEGITSLWRGIVPGLHRQCLFGGLRIGLYEPVKSPLFQKFLKD
jgi:solute carrier family 25 uncoupling protein 8/9